MKKLTKILGLGAVVAMASLASFAGETYRPEQLGAVEAVFDACGRVATQHRGQLEAKEKKLLESMSNRMLKEARESKEYAGGHAALISVLRDEIPRAELVAGCAAI